MHSPAHDDRCKDYVINAYVTGEEYFAVHCVQNSKYDWCPRVRDWVLEARAQQARERSTGSLGTPDSIRQSGSTQSDMPNGIDRVTAKFVGTACVYMCREMRRPATTNRSGNGGKI
jgi:hypothetical protein